MHGPLWSGIRGRVGPGRVAMTRRSAMATKFGLERRAEGMPDVRDGPFRFTEHPRSRPSINVHIAPEPATQRQGARYGPLVAPQSSGATSAIDCENVQRCPSTSSAVYWRSP